MERKQINNISQLEEESIGNIFFVGS